MTPLLILFATLMMAMLLLFQLYPLLVSRRSCGKKAPELEGLVSDNLLKNKRYSLYFWAPQCGTCPNMTHIVDKLSQERNDLAKIDAVKHAELAHQMGVMGTTPALVFIENGHIENIALGAKTEKRILSLLEKQNISYEKKFTTNQKNKRYVLHQNTRL
ncbi:MAG: Unknown protein [uncultured Thiotrichaceae bacterium]|uniref:Thioredoxin domain-containing protein n=1 Tax=uncultured Thiotrichaceae bacterium TaxID=298394 RepID=A0A6S6UHF9_9GAMM|nr:MAG: Unknown protein [uncultured Thiotrichaceae bacterium]